MVGMAKGHAASYFQFRKQYHYFDAYDRKSNKQTEYLAIAGTSSSAKEIFNGSHSGILVNELLIRQFVKTRFTHLDKNK
jgi:hypothetical protein